MNEVHGLAHPVDGHAFDSLWSDLAPVGRDADSGGYRRFAWTREDHMLREWFVGQCTALGLDVVEDRAGNQWAWWGNPDETPGIATGSHLDSVPDGGAFDGPLGVVSSVLSVRTLQEQGFQPARPIGVVNFVDEEGARFGVACAGSRIITGALDAERALGLVDLDGVTMAEVWQRAGRSPSDLGRDDATLRRVTAFVELHVEQGRAMIDLDDAPVAVGTDKGLVVPVVRDCDMLSIAGVEKAIGDLGRKARDGALKIEDMQGGTFTISNGGVYGSLMSSPILNPPQSGILGMHKIQDRPVVVKGEIVIRPMMYLALSYDHRIVDGKGAVTFLVRVKEMLEDPRRLLMDL